MLGGGGNRYADICIKNMDKAIITNDFFGVLTLLVILYGSVFQSKEKSRKKTAFIVLVSSVIMALLCDAFGYLSLMLTDNHAIQFTLFFFSHFLPFVVYIVFIHYIYLHFLTKSRKSISKTLFRAGIGYCFVAIISAFYYGLQNKIFVIEKNEFVAGDFYRGYLLTYLVIIVYFIMIVLINCRRIGANDSVAAIMFMIFPLFFVLLNLRYYELKFSITSLTISMMIINTLLNAEREQSLLANEAESAHLAHSDKLTGLMNRLAFEKQCEQMTGDTMTGVVFADLNGLKYANDNFGHKAGDELLCNFADILLNCFRKSDVYRISGDEFVVLLIDVPEEIFDNKVDMMNQKIKECDYPIAAWGSEYGEESKLSNMLEQAENKMYMQKKLFYEVYPEFRR